MMKRNALVIGLAVLLSACGFQLRGTGNVDFALKEIDLQARNAYGDTVKDLKTLLESQDVRVHAGAPYRLVLTNEQERQRTISYTGSARSAEYELTTQLDYEIVGNKNLSLIQDKLEVQNTYVHDGNNLAGSTQESTQARQEMRQEMLQRLSLRLRQITPAQLEQLQLEAEARVQAEADAAAEARRQQESAPQQSPLQLPISQ